MHQTAQIRADKKIFLCCELQRQQEIITPALNIKDILHKKLPLHQGILTYLQNDLYF